MYNYQFRNLRFFLLILLSILLFSISIHQTQYFHWSTILDQDIVIMYNSLLISSGIEQEYRDHPAYTTFLIHGLTLKIFSFFNLGPIGHINDLLSSNEPNEELQKLFVFCRNINIVINVSLVFLLYKAIISLKCSEISALLGTCILVISGWFTESIFILRSENLSIIFFLLSFICLINFFENRNSINIIFGGFFFGIAMLTKIQIIFLFIFFLIIYFLHINEKIFKKNINKFSTKYDKYIFIFYIFFFTFYLILQFKLQTYERFEKIKNLDLILYLVFNFFVLAYVFIRNKFDFTKLKLFITFLSLFFIGFSLIFFITLLFDIIGLVKLNYFILLRLTNPFHYMVEFHVGDHSTVYNDAKVNLTYFYNLFLIAISKFDYNYLKILILFLVLVFSLRNKSNIVFELFSYKFLIKCLIFFGILSIIFIMNLRGFLYYYETLVIIPYILGMSYFLKDFSKRYVIIINCLIIIYFSYCNFYLQEKRKYPFAYYFSSQTSMHLICDPDKIFYQDNSYKFFLQYYQNRFNDEFIIRLCNNNKS